MRQYSHKSFGLDEGEILQNNVILAPKTLFLSFLKNLNYSK